MTHPELEPAGDELPLEWWSDDDLAAVIAAWQKEIKKDT